MGHVRNYTIGDVISRYHRMLGKNVLQPIGWDAFGLPAENAAMKNRIAPSTWTESNIKEMEKQLRKMGFGYDWNREIATCRPNYYRWEQWMFTQLMKKGLVYKKNAVVNWDPVDQTVLANEQVIDGRGWRSGALVEQKEIPQWFMKISDYAQQLLDGLDELEGWPENVKTMQRNWIGRSEGINLKFAIENSEAPLEVYTTRPDTLMGVTYVAVAAQHPLAQLAAKSSPEVAKFIESCSHTKVAEADLATMDKLGIATGQFALHPISGKPVPIWIANFVLMDYGSGAVMAVPAHDQRDWEFAKKYHLEISQVIEPFDNSESLVDLSKEAFIEKGKLINSGEFDGLGYEQAFENICGYLEKNGQGQRCVNYRLRDWGVSRQRYWGAPIPVINKQNGQSIPVPEQDLPIELPLDVEFDDSGSPLKKMPSFYETKDPETGEPATRETDTFDTFMESSWYYARYTGPDNDQSMLDERANYWLPVDQYVGGVEHAILHLMYARFYHKLLRDMGLVDSDEPFKNLLTQGMVLAECWSRTDSSGVIHWHASAEVEKVFDEHGKLMGGKLFKTGEDVHFGGIQKMSKSKNNGIDPQPLIDKYGADTIRLFVMFASPPDQTLEWSDAGVEGSFRFIKRFWTMIEHHIETGTEPLAGMRPSEFDAKQKDIRRKVHQTIVKVTEDIHQRHTFNTAIAAVREMLNLVSKYQEDVSDKSGQWVLQEALESAVLLLCPVIPHVCESMWRKLGHRELCSTASWPVADQSALIEDEKLVVLQVNGKLRGKLLVPIHIDKAELEQLALENEGVLRHTEGKTIRKVIVVPGKLVNIVVSS